jgi:WD40 repeat protein
MSVVSATTKRTKRSPQEDASPVPKRAKFIARDHQRKLRLVRVGRVLCEGPLPVPEVCNLVKEYANEFEGIKLWTRSGDRMTTAILAVLDDGSLAYTSRSKVVLWDVDKSVPHMELLGHTANVTALVALPGHRLASGSADGAVRVWDARTGLCIYTLEGHETQVSTLTVLEDGTLASSSAWWIHVWDLSTGTRLKHFTCNLATSKRSVLGLAHGMLAVACMLGSVKVFDVSSGTRTHTMSGHVVLNVPLCVLPDKRLVSAARNGSVRLWQDLSGTVTSMSGHDADVHVMIALPDGKLVTGSKDRTVRVWNTQTETCVRTLIGHSEAILALVLLPDGRLASSALDSTIRVWDWENGECLLVIKPHSRIVQLAVLPGCKLAGSGHDEDTIYVWV